MAGAAMVLGLASILAAQAQTTTSLSATCSGHAVSNVITWTSVVTGGTAPYTYFWTGDSMDSAVGNTNASFSATYPTTGTYTVGIRVIDAASNVATSTCSATVQSVGPTGPPTPAPLPRVNQPMLSIGQGGAFFTHGMVVTSVSSGSFQGQVWGITYTVNWVGPSTEFFLRLGNKSSVSILQQVAVGDEVGVSGKITAAAPFVVNAAVVRNYSITAPRPDNEGTGSSSGVSVGGGSSDAQTRLSALLDQLKKLRVLIQGSGSSSNSTTGF